MRCRILSQPPESRRNSGGFGSYRDGDYASSPLGGALATASTAGPHSVRSAPLRAESAPRPRDRSGARKSRCRSGPLWTERHGGGEIVTATLRTGTEPPHDPAKQDAAAAAYDTTEEPLARSPSRRSRCPRRRPGADAGVKESSPRPRRSARPAQERREPLVPAPEVHERRRRRCRPGFEFSTAIAERLQDGLRCAASTSASAATSPPPIRPMENQPFWIDGKGWNEAGKRLVAALGRAADDGLSGRTTNPCPPSRRATRPSSRRGRHPARRRSAVLYARDARRRALGPAPPVEADHADALPALRDGGALGARRRRRSPAPCSPPTTRRMRPIAA